MLTTAEAAALLSVSRPRVLALIHLGTIKAEKHGRDWQVDPASVEAYKNSPRKPGARPKNKGKNSV
jgi:excisionase family DNA binding protein